MVEIAAQDTAQGYFILSPQNWVIMHLIRFPKQSSLKEQGESTGITAL